jgi:ACS family glucarate transporter-like MFS transporter
MRDMVNKAALYYTVDAAAALVTGWVTDFWIRRGSAAGIVRKFAMGLGWTMAAVGFLGWSSAGPDSYLAWLIVTGVGCGIGNSGIWAFSQTLAGPHAVGRWTGLQNGFANLAGVIGPALTGFIVDWTGHFQVALVITAGVSLLSGISWVFLVGRFEQVVWSDPIKSDLVSAVPEII